MAISAIGFRTFRRYFNCLINKIKGDITEKGYEKKRRLLLGPYIQAQLNIGKFFFKLKSCVNFYNFCKK